jgi:hypothetical protein
LRPLKRSDRRIPARSRRFAVSVEHPHLWATCFRDNKVSGFDFIDSGDLGHPAVFEKFATAFGSAISAAPERFSDFGCVFGSVPGAASSLIEERDFPEDHPRLDDDGDSVRI